MESSDATSPATPSSGDPDQRELDLQLGRQPAFTEHPWQIELIYRIALDTAVVVTAIVGRWVVYVVHERLLPEQLDWAVGVTEWTFRMGVLLTVVVAVTADLVRFVYRRAPTQWKRK